MLLDLKWEPNGQYLVGAAKSNVFFISNSGQTSRASGWSKNIDRQATLSVAFVGNELLIGALDGKILRFQAKGKSVTGALDAHKGAVNTLFASKSGKGLVSGGNDGKVIIWDDAFTKKKVIDLTTVKEFMIQNPRVRAVAESNDGKRIIIGTRSSNLIEVDSSGTLRCVNNGHFDKELWGLAVVPRSDEYITVGEDFLMAKWSVRERRLIKAAKLPYMGTVCDVSRDAKYVAVGCTNGYTLIFDVNNFSQVKAITDSKKQIAELKFSPDCKWLAVGGHDARVRMYSTNGFKLVSEFKGHHSTIKHLDWSLDSQVVMSNCTSYEILFFNAASGKQNTSGASAYKDEKWDTWTCTLGWPVQGIFPSFTDGTDVNACCRNQDGTVLATSDDFGKVNLYRYPSYVKKAAHNTYKGHSSHVTNVRFSAKEDFVISTGGNDKAIIQWKFIDNKKEREEEVNGQEIDSADFDPNEFRSRDEEVDKNDGHKKKEVQDKPNDLGDFMEAEVDEGDQAMATLAFLGDVKNSIPTGWVNPPRCADPPQGNLNLRHAFGFRCWDAKDTCKFTSKSNEVVFITAALGVTMTTNNFKQSFFNKHDEDLISIDISPCKRYCATGQMPAKGRSKLIDCFVWDTDTKQELAKLSGFHRGGINHIKFSPSSRLLLTIGMDDSNSLALYDWQNKKIICSSKVEKSEVLDCAWQDENNFATVTKDSVKFWNVKGGSCSAIKGGWGKDTRGVLASCVFAGNICFTGSWKGEIIPWQGGSKGQSIAAHKSGVFALHFDSKKNILYSGGGKNDGCVIAWTVNGSMLTKKEVAIDSDYVFNKECIVTTSGIRSIDTHPDGTLLVGSKDGHIFTKDSSGKYNGFMNAHNYGEVWGLACHPSEPLFVTSGGDKSIRVYDGFQRTIETLFIHSCECRGVDWSSDGKWIVAASINGEILLFNTDLDTPQIIQSSFSNNGKQWIEEIKFSPDSTMVAFGAHGGASKLEILYLNNEKLEKRDRNVFGIGLTSALLHLDWSIDSSAIVTNSQAYEIRWVNVNGRKNIPASSAKDIDWKTWTCKIGFPVQGIFETVDFSDINTVCRSENRTVLATGDDNQKVRLLKYPSVVPKSGAKSYTAHSSHVTRVRFCCNDNMLVSIGGNDKTVLVWTTDFGGENPIKAKLLGSQGSHEDEELDENEILGIFKSDEAVKGDQSAPPGLETPKADTNLGMFQEEEMGEGDQFMAVLPWLGAIKFPPTNFDPKKNSASATKVPKVKLVLDHVHGYRAQDKRNNIFILASGEVAYHAAAVGIVHDVGKNRQRFFIQHTDKILAMAMHPDRKTLATGENGARPSVYMWDSASMNMLFKISGPMMTKSVDNLSFSPSGKFLYSNAADDDHKMAIIDDKGIIVASEKGGREVILGIAWKSDSEYFTVGIKHFTQWSFSGSTIKGTKGKFTGNNALVSVAVVKQKGDIVCGSATGELQIWNGSSCTQVIKDAHKGMVDGLFVASNR